MSETSQGVVFDCVVYAQALINGKGPAARCLELARSRTIRLFWSDYVLAEIRGLPGKLPARFMVGSDAVEAFIQDTNTFASTISNVPHVYENPFDRDDSHYVDLAVSAGALLITSRDRHLLDLMDRSKIEGQDFAGRFPQLSIITPEQLLSHYQR